MNSLLKLMIGGVFAVVASTALAGTTTTATDMNTNWSCTTNASSATTDAEKAADEKMANTKGSAVSAYALAAQNCRDCTKITCEMDD